MPSSCNRRSALAGWVTICQRAHRQSRGFHWLNALRLSLFQEPEVCFYGSGNVFRANGLLSVWTKCLAKADLNNAVKEDSTGSLSDITAEKIAHDYVAPIAGIKALEEDQIVDAVMDEELANNGNIRLLVTALREIDCAKRRKFAWL